MASKRLLLLDHAMHPDLYRPVGHWLRHVPAAFEVTVCDWRDPVPDPRAFSHVIISGSEDSIIEPAPWVEERLGLIRTAVESGTPLLGSCHGHQMIALALGGPECVRRAATPEFGWVELDIRDEGGIFEGSARPAWTFTAHFDEVFRLWPGAKALARTENCSVAALRLEEAPVFGLQPHPEIDAEEGARLLQGFAPIFPEMARRPFSLPPRDSGLAADVMRNFLALGPGGRRLA